MVLSPESSQEYNPSLLLVVFAMKRVKLQGWLGLEKRVTPFSSDTIPAAFLLHRTSCRKESEINVASGSGGHGFRAMLVWFQACACVSMTHGYSEGGVWRIDETIDGYLSTSLY